MSQNRFQRACAWSGITCVTIFFLGFLFAGFIPPMSPSLSAEEVATFYKSHLSGIRVGAVFIYISGMFYAAFTAVQSGQMKRIPNVHPTVIYAQLVAGSFACLTFMVPGIFFVVAAFRPERSIEATQMLNDLSWIMLVMPWPPFMAQNFSFAYAVLSDRRAKPLFPRWLAFLNLWAPISFTPACLLPFFKSGPFAWSGLLVIWIPAFIFIVWFMAMTWALLRAISTEPND